MRPGGIWGGFLALAVIGFVCWSSPGRAALTVEEFVASPGARAFEAEDYEAALDGFWELLMKDPNDTIVLRYIGITLDRLGRSEEAVETLTRALELSPQDPAISFFLGVSLYKLGHLADAAALFEIVLALAPDTEYGAYARDFVTVIATQSAPEVASSPESAFDAYFQVGASFDDNTDNRPENVLAIPFNPIPSPEDNWRVSEYLSLGLNIVDSGPWLVRLEGHGYGHRNIKEEFRTFDIGQVGAAIDVEYATQVGTVAVVPSIGFESELNFQDYRTFSYAYGADAELDIGWSDWFKTNVFYEYRIGEFEDRGVTFFGDPVDAIPELLSRDNTNHNVGVTQKFIADLGGVIMVLSGGYAYTRMEAEGSNFDGHGDKALGGLTLYLPGQVVIDAFGSVAWDTRPHFLVGDPTGARLETTTYVAGVTIAVPLTEWLRATMSYEYTRQDGRLPNNPGFENNAAIQSYKRNIVTMALAYTLN